MADLVLVKRLKSLSPKLITNPSNQTMKHYSKITSYFVLALFVIVGGSTPALASTTITSKAYAFDTRPDSKDGIIPHNYPNIDEIRIDFDDLPATAKIKSASYNVILGNEHLAQFPVLEAIVKDNKVYLRVSVKIDPKIGLASIRVKVTCTYD
jgi:hypothetical protein